MAERMLLDAAPMPIASISPETFATEAEADANGRPPTRVLRGTITIQWPYSVLNRNMTFILAEPDFRLRAAGGQVCVEFRGPVAKLVKECGLGGGDEVLLSLEGAELERDEAVRPGMRRPLEWQLRFSKRVLMRIAESDDRQAKLIDFDEPAASDGGPEPLSILGEPATAAAAAAAAEGEEDDDDDEIPIPVVTPVRPTLAAGRKRRVSSLNSDEFMSPAFFKRARIFYGSVFEGAEIFQIDGADRGQGQGHTPFGRKSGYWKCPGKSRNPEIEEPRDDEPEDREQLAEAPEPARNGLVADPDMPRGLGVQAASSVPGFGSTDARAGEAGPEPRIPAPDVAVTVSPAASTTVHLSESVNVSLAVAGGDARPPLHTEVTVHRETIVGSHGVQESMLLPVAEAYPAELLETPASPVPTASPGHPSVSADHGHGTPATPVPVPAPGLSAEGGQGSAPNVFSRTLPNPFLSTNAPQNNFLNPFALPEPSATINPFASAVRADGSERETASEGTDSDGRAVYEGYESMEDDQQGEEDEVEVIGERKLGYEDDDDQEHEDDDNQELGDEDDGSQELEDHGDSDGEDLEDEDYDESEYGEDDVSGDARTRAARPDSHAAEVTHAPPSDPEDDGYDENDSDYHREVGGDYDARNYADVQDDEEDVDEDEENRDPNDPDRAIVNIESDEEDAYDDGIPPYVDAGYGEDEEVEDEDGYEDDEGGDGDEVGGYEDDEGEDEDEMDDTEDEDGDEDSDDEAEDYDDREGPVPFHQQQRPAPVSQGPVYIDLISDSEDEGPPPPKKVPAPAPAPTPAADAPGGNNAGDTAEKQANTPQEESDFESVEESSTWEEDGPEMAPQDGPERVQAGPSPRRLASEADSPERETADLHAAAKNEASQTYSAALNEADSQGQLVDPEAMEVDAVGSGRNTAEVVTPLPPSEDVMDVVEEETPHTPPGVAAETEADGPISPGPGSEVAPESEFPAPADDRPSRRGRQPNRSTTRISPSIGAAESSPLQTSPRVLRSHTQVVDLASSSPIPGAKSTSATIGSPPPSPSPGGPLSRSRRGRNKDKSATQSSPTAVAGSPDLQEPPPTPRELPKSGRGRKGAADTASAATSFTKSPSPTPKQRTTRSSRAKKDAAGAVPSSPEAGSSPAPSERPVAGAGAHAAIALRDPITTKRLPRAYRNAKSLGHPAEDPTLTSKPIPKATRTGDPGIAGGVRRHEKGTSTPQPFAPDARVPTSPQTERPPRQYTRSQDAPGPVSAASTAAAAAAAAAVTSPTRPAHESDDPDLPFAEVNFSALRKLARTLPDYRRLKDIRQYPSQAIDVAGVVTTSPASPKRPKKARDYLLSFTITDPSAKAFAAVLVQIMRPHVHALPVVAAGDVVLLRRFVVHSPMGTAKTFGLRAGDASGWAVFERARDDDLPQVRGPPVDITEQEKAYVAMLRGWWGVLDDKAMERLAKGTAKVAEVVQA